MTGDSKAVPAPSTSPTLVVASARKVVLVGAVVVLSVIVPMAVRVAVDGRASLDEALATEDIELRIERLGHAARWRLPLASHDEDALDALIEIGETAELGTSLAAYREARRALLSTRAWGLSDPGRYAMLCERIAEAMAAQEHVDDSDVGGEGDPYAFHLRALQDVPGPDPLWATVAAWGFVGWLASLVGFVARGLDDNGRVRPRSATRWGLVTMLLLVTWAVALAIA